MMVVVVKMPMVRISVVAKRSAGKGRLLMDEGEMGQTRGQNK